MLHPTPPPAQVLSSLTGAMVLVPMPPRNLHPFNSLLGTILDLLLFKTITDV